MQPDSLFTMDGLPVFQIRTVSPRDHRAARAQLGWRRLVMWVMFVSSGAVCIEAFVLFSLGLLPEQTPWLGGIALLVLVATFVLRKSFVGYPLTLQKSIRKGRRRNDFVTADDYSNSLVRDDEGVLLWRPYKAAEFLRMTAVQHADIALRKSNHRPSRIQERVDLKRSIVRLAAQCLGSNEHLAQRNDAIVNEEIHHTHEAHLIHQGALAAKKDTMEPERWVNKMRKSGARGRVLSRPHRPLSR